MGHLIEGAVAYYEATGKDKLLHAAERFADYATDYFGPEEGNARDIRDMKLQKWHSSVFMKLQENKSIWI